MTYRGDQHRLARLGVVLDDRAVGVRLHHLVEELPEVAALGTLRNIHFPVSSYSDGVG